MGKNIVLEYLPNNKNYVFNSIKFVDEAFAEKIDGNKISFNLGALNEIKEMTDDKLVGYSFEKNKPVIFNLESTIYDALYRECKNKKLSDDECNKIIIDGIKKIFDNVDHLEQVDNEGIISFKIIYKSKENKSEKVSSNIITEIDMSKFEPDKIIHNLKKKVIAQDDAVETIVNNIYNNQIIVDSMDPDVISTSKVNIFMDGPTGTGKTLIVKSAAKEMNLPINIVPATIFSAPGYKGTALEEMLKPLLDKTGGNLELAERGIVVLDEFDKLAYKGDNALEMNKAVQHNLLTYLGGTKVPIEYNGTKIEFDTSKITFICLGAFTDLRERKIAEGLDENKNYTIKPDDYISEGLLREVVGRFSLITATQSLGKEALVRILKESSISPLESLKKVGKIYGKEIIYDDELIDIIADMALKEDTGARALQTVVNGLSNQILSDLRDKSKSEIYLTKELLNKSQDVYVRRVA